ncbi:SET and MYND domain-containing protein 4-like [Culex pipiens pallens]|uniref:SET and MYND domain-containing protein 4-like n=1 Tax=Culex pipiens pallens TaxID=42434 RepID=UPI0019535BC5|nr:SET and MYND domain-containing protein 4-like [Culex pipiens pallens]
MGRDQEDSMISDLLAKNPCRSGELDLNWPVERIIKYVAGSSQLAGLEELCKSDLEASKLREFGNHFYRLRNLVEATFCYNQAICHAPPDSEQLGMGYANRSAICFEMRDYEMALFNIQMAKKHNYPDKLMAKLLERERNCRQRIADGHSKGTVPNPRMGFNVDINPRIPFLAKGIAMGYDPRFGRGLVAEKDFNAGDLILDETSELFAHDFNLCFKHCSQCSANVCQILIPCRTCVLFMYCSEECRELHWKLFHRFECGVVTKLCCVSGTGDIITPRFFFYGLTQFGDDLQAMMEYCEKEVSTQSNPLELDFANLDRMEWFRVLHNTHPRGLDSSPGGKRAVASYFVVFLMNPVVKSIIRTESHRQFFLRSLLRYSSMIHPLATTFFTSDGHMFAAVLPIGSLLNHSCDPHAIQSLNYGRRKVILVRPVRKGEQIFVSYGPIWWRHIPGAVLPFKCRCVVCDQPDREWHSLKGRPIPPKAVKDMLVLKEIYEKADVHPATKLIALQQFMKRYARHHPNEAFLGNFLKVYCSFLEMACETEGQRLVRARLQAELV